MDNRHKTAGAMGMLGAVGVQEEVLLQEGVVGDINYSFIDERGQTRPEWRLFLTLQADELRLMAADQTKRVVVVGGKYKESILLAALRGGLLNVLVTDEASAAYFVGDPELTGVAFDVSAQVCARQANTRPSNSSLQSRKTRNARNDLGPGRPHM
jgi:hypothetical protein